MNKNMRLNQKIAIKSGTVYTAKVLTAANSWTISDKLSPASETFAVTTKETVTEPGEHRVFECGSTKISYLLQIG